MRPSGERLGHAFFRTLPERPGVYLLCGPPDGVLYVGKNLRQRLGSYRSASTERLPRKLRRLLATVERIRWDECADEAAALARERELIVTLKPRFNTAGVYPAPRLRLGWTAGAATLDLGLANTVDTLGEHSEAGLAPAAEGRGSRPRRCRRCPDGCWANGRRAAGNCRYQKKAFRRSAAGLRGNRPNWWTA